jgi:hypothetical protein
MRHPAQWRFFSSHVAAWEYPVGDPFLLNSLV